MISATTEGIFMQNIFVLEFKKVREKRQNYDTFSHMALIDFRTSAHIRLICWVF